MIIVPDRRTAFRFTAPLPSARQKVLAALLVLGLLPVALGRAWAQSLASRATLPSVSLDEAVALALRASPDVSRALGSVRVARAGERTASGAYLPSLDVETNAIRSTTPG